MNISLSFETILGILRPSSPINRKLIGCKSVFKVKENPNGTINKYKACLVDKGFHQIARLDFKETFSLIVKSTTIRIVLTTIFLNGKFDN